MNIDDYKIQPGDLVKTKTSLRGWVAGGPWPDNNEPENHWFEAGEKFLLAHVRTGDVMMYFRLLKVSDGVVYSVPVTIKPALISGPHILEWWFEKL